jgi:hypothetical protein
MDAASSRGAPTLDAAGAGVGGGERGAEGKEEQLGAHEKTGPSQPSHARHNSSGSGTGADLALALAESGDTGGWGETASPSTVSTNKKRKTESGRVVDATATEAAAAHVREALAAVQSTPTPAIIPPTTATTMAASAGATGGGAKKKSGKCEHGRTRSQCKPCGGKGICVHGRQRYFCFPCGGKGMCVHGRQRHKCRPCGGASVCEHRYVCEVRGGGRGGRRQVCVHV